MRQRAFRCAAVLTLLLASACSANVEELRGSLEGVDAKIPGIQNGTRLTLVGDRTGPISEEDVVGSWVRFKVAPNNRAVAEAPDQCLSILRSDGTPLAASKTPLLFRNSPWIRARELQDQEAELRQSDATLQAEITRIETDRRNAVRWLDRNGDIFVQGQCDRPPMSARPVPACAPGEEKDVALRLCKDAVIDCAVIATTMGKTPDSMFDSSFLGNMAAQTCGVQTAKVMGDDFGIAGILAAAMKDASAKTAAQSVAADPTNPQALEQLAQAVMANNGFAQCQERAEQTCQTRFRRWQTEIGQRLQRCQSASQTAATARDKIAQINLRRALLERQLGPVQEKLEMLKNGELIGLQRGC